MEVADIHQKTDPIGGMLARKMRVIHHEDDESVWISVILMGVIERPWALADATRSVY